VVEETVQCRSSIQPSNLILPTFRFRHTVLHFAFLTFAVLTGAAAAAAAPEVQDPAPPTAMAPAPIRFLLSFDDGPSSSIHYNPTEAILAKLEQNHLQPGIKAIFFTQTRAVNGGGTKVGRALLRREYEAGHVLGFHTATPRHSNHRFLREEDLEASLARGIADLEAITGAAPKFVRPPFWNYDARTLAMYHRHGMQMVLTELSANDGVIYGINFSMTKRRNMRKLLLAQRERWRAGAMPEVDGSTPIVVTFHDVNTYTASVLEDYMDILLDVARELEMPTAAKPFYDDRDEIERAAMAGAVHDGESRRTLPGIWNWLWQ
jgi:peptidoglycan-N-acetylglucosamine deacetylase